MFNPWVGKMYGDVTNQLGGARIMILGESHYTDDEGLIGKAEPNGTIETIEKYALGTETKPFFTKLLQLVSGKKKWALSPEQVRAYWDAVVFYQYVPVYVAGGPRVRPSNAMFEMGVGPFQKVLEVHRPDVVIVCGVTLWWWVLKGVGFKRDPSEVSVFQIGTSQAMKIKHPSTGFSSERWHAKLREVMHAPDKPA